MNKIDLKEYIIRLEKQRLSAVKGLSHAIFLYKELGGTDLPYTNYTVHIFGDEAMRRSKL